MIIHLSIEGSLETDKTLQGVMALLGGTAQPDTAIASSAPATKPSKAEKPKETKAPTPAAATEQPKEATPPVDMSSEITFEDVRAMAVKAYNTGKKEEIAAIFTSHGNAQLSEIDKAEFPAVIKELEALL